MICVFGNRSIRIDFEVLHVNNCPINVLEELVTAKLSIQQMEFGPVVI